MTNPEAFSWDTPEISDLLRNLYYEFNKFGIRIENLIFIKKTRNKLCFENLTFAPIDKDLIDEKMLNTYEKNYLFNYHLETYSKISPFLNEKQKKWLAKLI